MTIIRTKNTDSSSSLLIAGLGCAFAVSSAMKIDSLIRHGQTIWENPTRAKLERQGYYAIAVLLPLISIAATRDRLLSIVTLIGSAVSIFFATQIRDYQDPKELAMMRAGAQQLSFPHLVKLHGLSNLHLLQLPELQQKFQNHYKNESFGTIIDHYPLRDIEQYHLAPLTPQGFLHDKFVDMVKKEKLTSLDKLQTNPIYKRIMSEKMYEGLIRLKAQYEEIPGLDVVLQGISDRYPNRMEILRQKYKTDKERLPNIALRLAQHKVNRSQTEKTYKDAYDAALLQIDLKYPNRKEVQEPKYRQKLQEIQSRSEKIYLDAKNRALSTPSREEVGSRHTGPQTVKQTIENGSSRVPVGSAQSNPNEGPQTVQQTIANDSGRVPVGSAQSNSPARTTALYAAENAGRAAAEAYRFEAIQALNWNRNHQKEMEEQNLHDVERDQARAIYSAQLASLKILEDQYTIQETARLSKELEDSFIAKENQGVYQQEKYEIEKKNALQYRENVIPGLEAELARVLTL